MATSYHKRKKVSIGKKNWSNKTHEHPLAKPRWVCENKGVMENISEKLDKLADINQMLREILTAVAKPKENKLVKAMELIVLFGGITIF